MAANVKKNWIKKINSMVERMHNCMSSVETIVLTLKEHFTTFLENNDRTLTFTPTIVTVKSSLKQMQCSSKTV